MRGYKYLAIYMIFVSFFSQSTLGNTCLVVIVNPALKIPYEAAIAKYNGPLPQPSVHSLQSLHPPSSSSNTLQQRPLSKSGDVEQYPSFQSNTDACVISTIYATAAVKNPMRAAASHPCSDSNTLLFEERCR